MIFLISQISLRKPVSSLPKPAAIPTRRKRLSRRALEVGKNMCHVGALKVACCMPAWPSLYIELKRANRLCFSLPRPVIHLIQASVFYWYSISVKNKACFRSGKINVLHTKQSAIMYCMISFSLPHTTVDWLYCSLLHAAVDWLCCPLWWIIVSNCSALPFVMFSWHLSFRQTKVYINNL